jgi:hypothetical protein
MVFPSHYPCLGSESAGYPACNLYALFSYHRGV